MFTALIKKAFNVAKPMCLHRSGVQINYFPKKFSHDGDALGKVTEISDFTLGDFGNPGDKISLGRSRYVTVNNFMNKALVDIRVYFEKDGILRPGATGVSLKYSEWKKLKENIDLIDERLEVLIKHK